jgi:hypothetical protein
VVQNTIFIGLDVHKESIAVAIADGRGGEVRSMSVVPHTPEAIRQVIPPLRASPPLGLLPGSPTRRMNPCAT